MKEIFVGGCPPEVTRESTHHTHPIQIPTQTQHMGSVDFKGKERLHGLFTMGFSAVSMLATSPVTLQGSGRFRSRVLDLLR